MNKYYLAPWNKSIYHLTLVSSSLNSHCFIKCHLTFSKLTPLDKHH